MIITAFGSVETAVQAMKIGAFDFIQKPFAPEVVRLKVERALELRNARRARSRLESENEILRQETGVRYGEIVGAAPCMQAIYRVVEKVAPTDSSVLVTGDSGTGKELVARAIHTGSGRKDESFIKVNCGALTETLLESEMFGHEKGSFTGAVKRKLGRFELADKGTLFLDEIGDISPALQQKLLRVLQEHEFERVGGEATIRVDVRVVSATNKDLKAEVAAGRFREDLYYRLHIVPIQMPPLRDRKDDIPELIEFFLAKKCEEMNVAPKRLTGDATQAMRNYRWPGNVRELENVIERTVVLSDGEEVGPNDLPLAFEEDPGRTLATADLSPGKIPLNQMLDDLERELITRAMEEANRVKTRAAEILGIKTSALYYKLDKYGLE